MARLGRLKYIGLAVLASAVAVGASACAEEEKIVTPAAANVVALIKETEGVYTLHKAESEMNMKISNDTTTSHFQTVCGYKSLIQSTGSHNELEYIVHEGKGIIMSNVEYRLYKDQADIHEKLMQQTELCEDCFAEVE